jgi:site-specific recombinase XerC
MCFMRWTSSKTRTLAAYLGHGNIATTARYTKMDATRFDGFWKD